MEADWFVLGWVAIGAVLFASVVAVPLCRSIRYEGAALPPAGGPGHLGVEGPRRRP